MSGHPPSRRGRAALPALLVGVLLLAAAAAAGFATMAPTGVERPFELPARPMPTMPTAEAPPPVVDEAPGEGSPVVAWILAALLATALAALAALVLWLLYKLLRRLRVTLLRPRWLRMRQLPGEARVATEPLPPLPPEQELVDAVAEAVRRSEDTDDPRQAVIACWVRLEEAAAAAGVPRYDSDTATELVTRLLRARSVSEPALSGFAEAYWFARYGTRPVDEQLRDRAREALRRLRDDLHAGARP